MNEDRESQRGQVIHSELRSQQGKELEFKMSLSQPQYLSAQKPHQDQILVAAIRQAPDSSSSQGKSLGKEKELWEV